MTTCGQCGRQMPDDEKTCARCGATRTEPVTMVNGGLLASLANGFTMAPLVTMGVDKGSGLDLDGAVS
ncbi:hypothetical protein [Bifidobacterium aerophilum]|uniref:Zinc-ribbon domain-containing protein n=1 Tax=Bifidobacterium aerophilum TaxID=1798155 RepID=A0A6N9Z6P9_9BIFI|nr:hypothetical protein [Bifidobacterium aerophilum]NEG90090.1 hypothetical protein [Bifidobacterium aerophilum]